MAGKSYLSYLLITILVVALIVRIFVPLSFFETTPKMEILSFMSSFVVGFCVAFLIGYNAEKVEAFFDKFKKYGIPMFPSSSKNSIRFFKIIGYGGATLIGVVIIYFLFSLVFFSY